MWIPYLGVSSAGISFTLGGYNVMLRVQIGGCCVQVTFVLGSEFQSVAIENMRAA